jgi:MarR family transcriptional regulator for hemolysin
MPRPTTTPIGLVISRTAKTLARAFDTALTEAGASLPTWLILLSLKTRTYGNQRQMAEAIGIQGATLTHHLNAMERNGLLTRHRDPNNRRVHNVELTDEGHALFARLAGAAQEHDERLRAGFTAGELATFAEFLGRIQGNVEPPKEQ